ncbi:lipoyl synthase [candidate division WOR-3 bacterium]|nr:lipoyl synthase [candidate division WOR-3 bacterium]
MFRKDHLKKPEWLKVHLPSGNEFGHVHRLLRQLGLYTVCEEARCPNMHECWNKKSATIMILGKVCTRACRFCAVATGDPNGAVDREEPDRVAKAVQMLGLRYVVITSVDRDDLNDLGSAHYAATIARIQDVNPDVRIEALIPDFSARRAYLKTVVGARPFVLGHNVETVRRLTPYIRDRRCAYQISLDVLRSIKDIDSSVYTKSGFMIGLGEEHEEIVQTLHDLKDNGVDIVTIGQYLQPTRRHHIVQKYYTPDEFAEFKKTGEEIGIPHVLSGPLVRSSYHASEIIS